MDKNQYGKLLSESELASGAVRVDDTGPQPGPAREKYTVQAMREQGKAIQLLTDHVNQLEKDLISVLRASAPTVTEQSEKAVENMPELPLAISANTRRLLALVSRIREMELRLEV